jgi:hypothetical protein
MTHLRSTRGQGRIAEIRFAYQLPGTCDGIHCGRGCLDEECPEHNPHQQLDREVVGSSPCPEQDAEDKIHDAE